MTPRYRTLDGDEIELPFPMGRWVLVPRGIARFDPELAWALDYDDAPEPEDADPRLDFSEGALLVPVERWNERAELEPNLAPAYPSAGTASRSVVEAAAVPVAVAHRRGDGNRPVGRTVVALTARGAVLLLAALAVSYLVGVAAWLWSLRDGISGPDVGVGLMLIGIAVLLAWLSGVVGAARRPPASRAGRRTWPELGVAVLRASDDPLAILRAGLAMQLAGFAALVILR